MTRIAELGPKLADVPRLIAEYEDGLIEAKDHLRMSGKRMDVALAEQGSWTFYYGAKKSELKTLVKFMELQVASVRGELIRRYTENYSRALGDRVLNNYVDNEPEYLSMRQLALEIEEMYEKYDALMDAFKSRGFALNNTTNLKIAQLHDLPAT